MNLGANAFTVASHLTLVGILGLLIVRIMILPHGDSIRSVVDHGFRAAVAIAAVGLIIERLYYVGARALTARGVDLWQMHPAPEVLSLVVTLALYGVMVPMILADASSRIVALRKVMCELIVTLALWAGLSWVLY